MPHRLRCQDRRGLDFALDWHQQGRKSASKRRRSRVLPTLPTRSQACASAACSRTPMCRSCSGARSAPRRTPSSSKVTSTNWRKRPGRTPYKFRRALLAARPDFLGVLDTIAEKSDWGKPLPAGAGRGIAIYECYGTIIGQVAEVTVSQKGEVRVDRVVAGVDCGHVVNPGIVEAQIQSGGDLRPLGAALYGEITIKDGRVEQSNFDSYQVVAWPTRRRSRSISRCPAARNGAASASPARPRRHRRSPTRSSRPPARACGRCRSRT